MHAHLFAGSGQDADPNFLCTDSAHAQNSIQEDVCPFFYSSAFFCPVLQAVPLAVLCRLEMVQSS